MEFFNQLKYLKQISQDLPLFKDKGNYLFNCRCVICGDSKKDKFKARGYFYKLEQNLVYKCHNCGASLSFVHFLKDQFPATYKQALIEGFIGDFNNNSNTEVSVLQDDAFREQRERNLAALDKIKAKRTGAEIARFQTLSELPNDHPAKNYLINRNLGEFLDDFYLIPDVAKLMMRLPAYREKKIPEMFHKSAIGIPHWNKDKSKLNFMQCRFLDHNVKVRYVTLRVMALDESVIKIYGLERLNYKSPYINITEGAFDSMCVDNAVAVSGLQSWKAILKDEELKFFKNKGNSYRFILDNDWQTNKDVKKTLKRIIKAGYHVVIFPESIRKDFKDLNDLYKVFTREELAAMIEQYTYKGLQAELEVSNG